MAPPPSDDPSDDAAEGVEKMAPEKESTPELPGESEGPSVDSDAVYLEGTSLMKTYS